MSHYLPYPEYVRITLEAERKLPIPQQQIIIENKMRGICLTISADMEALLLRIMLYCRINETQSTLQDFTKKTLDWKLKNAIADLKKYEPILYKELELDFKELKRIAKLRNKIAHCPFVWEGNDVSYVKIFIWVKSKGTFKPKFVKLKRRDFDAEMQKYQELIFRIIYGCRNMEEKILEVNPGLGDFFQSGIFKF